jgi:tetratricopeptide (TPR) repeat protein
MKNLFFAIAFFASLSSYSQNAHETAFAFMRTGDHDNAILVLNKALQTDPDNEQLMQDMALAYYYKKDFAQAKKFATRLIDRNDVDVTSYQIAGTVYRALEEVKEADKMYKKAIKKYPTSGALYSEYGELLWSKNDDNAIAEWERGMQADPSYPGNYYHASTYYFYTKDKVWSVIYGEIFVNMEYLTERAREIKEQLLKAYKEKLFMANAEATKPTSAFAQAVYDTYAKQSSVTGRGLTVETLTMVRTRFILDWYKTYAEKFPFRLFDYQQQLIRTGMFEAYNQWLFGPIENLAAFDQWTKTNAEAYKKFTTFQRGRIFKMPQGQFYAGKRST